MTQTKRENFSGSITTFFATLSAAVGLGNIWRFPYVVGENGGAAFLLIYFGCVFLIGLPILIAEFILGRSTQKNVVTAYEMHGGSFWKIAGFMAMASSILIALFYTAVTGWVYHYFLKSLTNSLALESVQSSQSAFLTFINDPTSALLWQWFVILLATLVICLGVQKGIERVTKYSMPLLFLLILICLTQSLSLPKAGEGISFLLQVDFSKLSRESFLTALGLAFFKISLGTGAMITYASYFNSKVNIVKNASQIVIADTIVSLLVGLVVFPVVFTFGLAPESGPGLLFETIPLVFSKMSFGRFLTPLFFLLAASAATSVTIALFEPSVSYLIEKWGLSRQKATINLAIFITLVGSLAALSATPNGLLGEIKIFGKSFFDLFDFTSSNLLMPLGGLFTALVVGWRISPELVKNELTNQGQLILGSFVGIYLTILRYITPVLVLVVFLQALGLF